MKPVGKGICIHVQSMKVNSNQCGICDFLIKKSLINYNYSHKNVFLYNYDCTHKNIFKLQLKLCNL